MHLVFDIGGTNMRLGVSRNGMRLAGVKKVRTPQRFADAVEEMRLYAGEQRRGEHIVAAGGGIPGPLDRKKETLARSPHLPDWKGKPIRAAFAKAIGAPVRLENDAAIVGLGEAVRGAGKGKRIVAYLTVSTGVGGARIVGGRIDESASGFEPGHQVIVAGGARCLSCGGEGHLEAYVSGSALEKRIGKEPRSITDPAVWNELEQWLAYGLNNVIAHWSPDVVVLGGAMVLKTPGISVERVRKRLKGMPSIFSEIPPIVPAAMGDDGGLHGALAYIAQQPH